MDKGAFKPIVFSLLLLVLFNACVSEVSDKRPLETDSICDTIRLFPSHEKFDYLGDFTHLRHDSLISLLLNKSGPSCTKSFVLTTQIDSHVVLFEGQFRSHLHECAELYTPKDCIDIIHNAKNQFLVESEHKEFFELGYVLHEFLDDPSGYCRGEKNCRYYIEYIWDDGSSAALREQVVTSILQEQLMILDGVAEGKFKLKYCELTRAMQDSVLLDSYMSFQYSALEKQEVVDMKKVGYFN